jgi:hypothetical protein
MRYGIDMPFSLKAVLTATVNRLAKLSLFVRKSATRQFFTYFMMVGFILFTSVGAGIFSPALGFIAAGITCGIFGFLLGLE